LENTLVDDFFLSDGDKRAIYPRLAMTVSGRNSLIRFLKEKHVEIRERLGDSAITGAVNSISSYAATETELQDVSLQFFS